MRHRYCEVVIKSNNSKIAIYTCVETGSCYEEQITRKHRLYRHLEYYK